MMGWSEAIRRAEQLAGAGQHAAAIAAAREAVAWSQNDPEALAAAAGVLVGAGDPAGALAMASDAMWTGAGGPAVYQAHGRALVALGRIDDGVESLRKAIELAPDDPRHVWMLARALVEAGRFHAASGVCRGALARMPGNPAFVSVLFNAASQLCEMDEVWRDLDLMSRFIPDHLETLSQLCAASNTASTSTPAEVAAFHARYGEAVARTRASRALRATPAQDPERRLRVGVVSYDFRRNSSVSFFLEPIFAGLDPERFALAGFHTGPVVDEGTERFRSRAELWQHLPDPDPDALADTVAAYGIDIVIEVNGHSGKRTMPAFEPRCAPVQVSYLGYSNTTGLRSFDWRIVDGLTDPTPAADALATERLWRLDPCFLCFVPSPDAPEPAPPPCLTKGHTTFGALSELSKLNDGVLKTWGRLLAAVPGARLLMKNRALLQPDVEGRFRARLATAGIEPARVELLPRDGTYSDHLNTYARIDVALDTFPYNGTTTICEALLMGVPMVGLRPGPEHDRHAARVGVSLLTAAGLADMVAKDREDYIGIAAALAAAPARLASLRQDVRARFLASPVCDTAAFAARFGAALREMWREKCGTTQVSG